MEYRELGKSGLRTSAIGLGCMGMSHGYGVPADKKEMTDLLAVAVDMGYNFFDTAESYGTDTNPHDNEEFLGNALKPYRDKVVIASKCGISFVPTDGTGAHNLVTDASPEAIRRAVEGSLRRLQTDHIDLYYQHRIDPKVAPEVVADTMAGLIKEGKILHWGISETTEDYLRRAHAVCPVAAVQNRYSLMARWHESLFPTLEELGVGFVAFSPLANGILSNQCSPSMALDKKTDMRAVIPQFQADSFKENEALFAYLNQLAETHHATSSQIALAWMLGKKPWIVPIPGTRKLSRLKENAGAADIHLSAEEVAQIDQTLLTLPMSDVFGGSKIVK